MSQVPHIVPKAIDIDEMSKKTTGDVNWLWEGYIAFGSITLFTSRWKTGKTTLISALLSRMNQGGMLAGSAVKAAPAVVMSEETPAVWVARNRKTPFGPNVHWMCRPFLRRPTMHEWRDAIIQFVQLTKDSLGLFVIDPLSVHLPGANENFAKVITAALAPLQASTSRNRAVLLLHHSRKGKGIEPRGSGALSGMVDITMELDANYVGMAENRRRWLRATGRHDGIPRERLIELTEAGDDYLLCNPTAEECADGWSVLKWVLSDAKCKFTRDKIIEHWPEQREKPQRTTLWRWLDQACTANLLRRDGCGRKGDPFRYWLPERQKYFGVELQLEPTPKLGPLDL